MIYCFDIDGTICTNMDGDYANAEPFNNVIEKINRLYEEENIIYFYTARGATTGIDWREVTEIQLKKWKVKYHKLFFGKPTADLYIDDKCINIKEWLFTEKK
ncbi:MAG: hypothetical protein RDU14_06990 [Melioribacteraceae bacterium]|nr:hypothetical protein [Melioribacteraceae bacterium]